MVDLFGYIRDGLLIPITTHRLSFIKSLPDAPQILGTRRYLL